MSSEALAGPATCVVCGDGGDAGLCSLVCRRAAVREREDNVRRFRRLRRGGGGPAGDVLTRRNAELTEALLASASRSRPAAPAAAGIDRIGT